MNTLTLYTVGHSNRQLEELMVLLKSASIDTLVDVRAQPRSQRHPQFNESALRAACENAGMIYHWAGRQLGGLRAPRADSPHVALEKGRRGFADYMGTDAFKQGAMRLQQWAACGVCAVLCAERDPMQCHRALIADYLSLQAVRVVHLIALGESQKHTLSLSARRESAALIYDRQATARLNLE